MSLPRTGALLAVGMIALFLVPPVLAAAPTVSEAFPAYARPGVPARFWELSKDSDGVITLTEWDMNNDGIVDYTNPPAQFFHTYASAGSITGLHRVTDNDGNVASRMFTVIVDGTAPVTAVAIPAAGASGWHTSKSVDVTITRSDAGGSNLGVTMVDLDGVATTYGAGGPIPRTVSGDGTHTLTVFSRDRAGNSETPQTFSIRIDSTAPAVRITEPGVGSAAGAPTLIAGFALVGSTVNLRAEAGDDASGVASVAFYAAGSLVAVDADGTNGFTASWDTTGRNAGSYPLRAVAINGAGLAAFSDSSILLVTPQQASASAALFAANDCDIPIGAACTGGDSAGASAGTSGAQVSDGVAPFALTQGATAALGYLSDGASGGYVLLGGGAAANGQGCSATVSGDGPDASCASLVSGSAEAGVVGQNDCDVTLPTACSGGDSVGLAFGDGVSVTDGVAPFGVTQGLTAWLGYLGDGGSGGYGGGVHAAVAAGPADCGAQTWGGAIEPGLAPQAHCAAS